MNESDYDFLKEPEKSLGQHWLNDSASLEAMCAAADVRDGDVVLEIGPGQGSLTERLLAHGAEVVAVEYDNDLIPALQKKFNNLPSSKFWVECADIRKYDLANMPDEYKIVANIPYYLTANLFRILNDTAHKPSTAALLVQREVAERIAAKPGQLSLIAILVQLEYEISLRKIVPAKLFRPPPKVDSQIIVLNKRLRSLWVGVERTGLLRLLKAGFANRRKTLQNSLSAGLHISKDQAAAMLKQSNISNRSRAQELSLDDWHRLYETALTTASGSEVGND